MGVRRATVSGLMAAVDSDDRRKLIARLTAKGEIVVEAAFGVAMAKLGVLFTTFSREELATLSALLDRVREEFDARR